MTALKKYKKITIIISSLIFVALCGYMLFSYTLAQMVVHDSAPNDIKFSSENWKEGNVRERGGMVDSFLDSVEQKSITRDEVINLLGQPDDMNQINSNKRSISYTVDKGHMLPYDLIFYIDSSNMVQGIVLVD